MSKKFDLKKLIFKRLSKKLRGWIFFISIILTALGWTTFVNKTQVNESNILTADFSNSDLLFDFLNVGDADCAIIHNKDTIIIIDGGKKITDYKVVEFLKDEVFKNMKKNQKINLIVLTHPHEDHYGGIVKIVTSFDLSRFVTTDLEVDFSKHSGLRRLFDILGDKKIKIEHPKPGDYFTFGNGKIRIDILGPLKKDRDNVNNNSIVLKVTYSGKKFLFMGDAEKNEEQTLINSGQDLSADVIKIGHHGSKTSTGEKFLFKVHPRYAVISAENERYPFPAVQKAFTSYSNSVNGQFDYFVTRNFEKSIRLVVNNNGEIITPSLDRSKRKAA